MPNPVKQLKLAAGCLRLITATSNCTHEKQNFPTVETTLPKNYEGIVPDVSGMMCADSMEVSHEISKAAATMVSDLKPF